jgi:hypothetical protein
VRQFAQDLKRRTLDRKETIFCHAKAKPKIWLSPDFDSKAHRKREKISRNKTKALRRILLRRKNRTARNQIFIKFLNQNREFIFLNQIKSDGKRYDEME